jgi:hypothetical protein
MRTRILFLVVALGSLIGCNSGEVPVEQVAPKAESAQPNSSEEAIKANPNIPPAAKEALGAGK